MCAMGQRTGSAPATRMVQVLVVAREVEWVQRGPIHCAHDSAALNAIYTLVLGSSVASDRRQFVSSLTAAADAAALHIVRTAPTVPVSPTSSTDDRIPVRLATELSRRDQVLAVLDAQYVQRRDSGRVTTSAHGGASAVLAQI